VMVVNLSLERSANIKMQTRRDYKSRQLISAEDGKLAPWTSRMDCGCRPATVP